MSDSDSDLDFESADEDTSCDVNAKNNTTTHNTLSKEVKCDSTMSVDSPNIEHCISETLKNETSIDAISVKLENLDNELNIKTKGIDDDVNKSISAVENNCSESNECELTASTKSLEIDTKVSSVEAICAENMGTKTLQEKQRVPLRLEKKIQQKQQMSKDNSFENNANATCFDKQTKVQEQKSSWGFGNWGTSLLSTAASSVSTFTNQVSHGIGTVLETVENTLGAPPPEELASTLSNKKNPIESSAENVLEKENFAETEENSSAAKSSILPDMSSWTKVLENTGSKVLMGGLDTLELIGKKTIDIITEGDPGLRRKRAVFSEGITLSQILRDAKAEADESKQETEGIDTVHYSQIFDEYQGLVHLEALEMLSKQSEMKIQRLLIRLARNAEIRKNMEEIKSLCENIPPMDDPTDCGDFEDFITVCQKYVLELNISFNIENIIKVQQRITDVLRNYENTIGTTTTPEEIYHSAICSLAEFTAKCIEAFHKLAEQILVQQVLEPSVEQFATNLTGLTAVMCVEINNLASRYHHCLETISKQYDETSEKANVTAVVTNLYLEAGNSNKYIQDAFLLLIPVLQVSLLESS